MQLSTSWPMYPACVKELQSHIVKGTLSFLLRVLKRLLVSPVKGEGDV